MFKNGEHAEPFQTKRMAVSTSTFIAVLTISLMSIFVSFCYLTNIQFRGWIQKCLSTQSSFFGFDKGATKLFEHDENVVHFGIPGTKFTQKDIDEVAEEAERELAEKRRAEL